MTRLSISKSKLGNENSKPVFLNDLELKKIISKLEKSYPFDDKIPDLAKYGDSEKYFHKNALSIKRKLDRFIVIVTDLADFCTIALPILLEFPFAVTDFNLERNKNLSLLYFDLLSSYVKIMLLFSSIKERKVLVALYAATSIFLSNTIEEPKENLSKVPSLIAHSEDVYLHFITSFKNLSSNSTSSTNNINKFKNMVLQFKSSIIYGDDIEKLTSSSVLNFMLEGEEMGLPCKEKMPKPLQGGSDPENDLYTNLSAYSELMNYNRYINYVICSILAVPILLYDADVFQLYQIVGSKRNFISIFRDDTFSIHAELEKISYEYISKKDAPHIAITPGFKLKTALRSVAKEAAQTAGLRARSRRSFLINELTSVTLLLKTIPGLIAPKLPQVLALLALAKSELLDFFIHMDGVDSIRKDVRKHYQIQDTVDNIFPFLHSLHELVKDIRTNSGAIKLYYTQFVSINDLRIINPLCERCSKNVLATQPFFDEMIQYLRMLSVPSGDKGINLETFRLSWDKAMETMCTGVTDLVTRDIYFESLIDRMHSTSERTMFIDRVDFLVEEYGEPYELFWQNSKILRIYKKCVSHTEKSPIYPTVALSALWIPTLSHTNLHPEALYEASALEDAAHELTTTLLTNLNECMLAQFRELWDHLFSLDLQCQPVEAGKRIVRAMKSKRNSILKGGDSLPGEESEGWAAISIDKLIKIKSFLAQLSATANSWKTFRVCNKNYHLVKFMTQRLREYVNEQVADIFTVYTNPDDITTIQLQRPTYAILRYITLATTLKYVCSFLSIPSKAKGGTSASTLSPTAAGSSTLNSVDFSSILQEILYNHIVPNNEDPDSPVLVDNIYSCLVDIITEISSTEGGGGSLVWSPFRREFCSNPHPNNANVNTSSTWGRRGSKSSGAGGAASGQSELELIFNQTDLFHLCKIIGPLGTNYIEQRLLKMIGVHVKSAFSFIKENKDILGEYRANYCLGTKFSIKSLPNIESFYQTLKTIGLSSPSLSLLSLSLF